VHHPPPQTKEEERQRLRSTLSQLPSHRQESGSAAAAEAEEAGAVAPWAQIDPAMCTALAKILGTAEDEGGGAGTLLISCELQMEGAAQSTAAGGGASDRQAAAGGAGVAAETVGHFSLAGRLSSSSSSSSVATAAARSPPLQVEFDTAARLSAAMLVVLEAFIAVQLHS
jgi:hypothetical protein